MADTPKPMRYAEAVKLDIETADDRDLVASWHAHASHISYLNADDYGGDWKLVPPIAERARVIEKAIRNRGLERPTGSYLITDNDRIDWETGDWSPGWAYRKVARDRDVSLAEDAKRLSPEGVAARAEGIARNPLS